MDVLLVVLSLLLLVTGQAGAQTTEPIYHTSVDFTFGQLMRFRLTVENASDIEEITLFFSAPEFPNTFTVEVPFETATKIDLVHPVDLTQVRLAPFTTVTYWWVLRSGDGDEITIPKEIVAYDDTQFEWRGLRQNGHTVYWTGEDRSLGQLALDIVLETLDDLRRILPIEELAPIRIYIYPSSADLRAALRLTGRDWVGAHANPELGVMLLSAVNTRTAATDLRQSIPHEMVHFLLYRMHGDSYDDLPLWLNEGMATLAEADPNPNYQHILQEAIADGTVIPFAQLCDAFPATEEGALLAYAQSFSLVQFIQDRHGNRNLSELIRVFGDGADCHSAVTRTLDTTLIDLERAWLRSLQPRPTIIKHLSDNGIWLLLLIGGYGVTRLLVIKPTTN